MNEECMVNLMINYQLIIPWLFNKDIEAMAHL